MEQFEAKDHVNWSLVVSGPELYPDGTPYYTVAINNPQGVETGIAIDMEQAHGLKYWLIEQLGQ